MKKTQLTKEGYNSLQTEYQTLKTLKRPQAVERLHKARSMGDLSENSEYTAAKENLSLVEGRILEVEEILKNVEIVNNNNGNHYVDIGSQVIVQTTIGNDSFKIVGEFEADPLKKKLSHTSPIGKALIGKKVGDEVEISVPAGKLKYKIVEIK
jgi:transcription elongation factor GreA